VRAEAAGEHDRPEDRRGGRCRCRGHGDGRLLAGDRVDPQPRAVLPGGGILRPAIVLDGAAVGIWSSKRAGAEVRVEFEPFDELDATTAKAIEDEVADLGRFEETPVAWADPTP